MSTLTPQRLTELKLHANNVRVGIIRSLLAAGSGHSAGPLDMADVFTVLYEHCLLYTSHGNADARAAKFHAQHVGGGFQRKLRRAVGADES